MQGENPINQKPKLLIVEDDKVTIDVLRLYLGKKYELDKAINGEEAMKKVAENDYDAFLMDIGLPGKMNGMDTTKKLKEIKNNKNKPFIAITAYAMKGDKEYFLSEGLTHYIVKPFNKQNLLDTIAKALNIEQDK